VEAVKQAIDIQLSEEDYVAANRLSLSYRRMAYLLLIGALVMVGFIVAVQYMFHGGVLNLPLLVVVVGGYFVVLAIWMAVVRFLLLPVRARRIFRQQKAMRRQHRLSWDENGLIVESTTGHAITLWSDIVKWRENRRLFLVYTSDIHVRMVPKRAFSTPEQVAEFGHLLRTKVSPRPGVARKVDVAEAFT
jgi:hypothetical protein